MLSKVSKCFHCSMQVTQNPLPFSPSLSVVFPQSWYLGELSSIPSHERDSDSANKCPPELQHKHHWWTPPPPHRGRELKTRRGGGGARSVGNGGNNQQAALKTIVFVLCPLSPLPSTLSSPNLSSHRDIGQEDLSWFGANLIRSALANPMPCQSVIVWEEPFYSKYCDVSCTKKLKMP